jgi:hypothetical protein
MIRCTKIKPQKIKQFCEVIVFANDPGTSWNSAFYVLFKNFQDTFFHKLLTLQLEVKLLYCCAL